MGDRMRLVAQGLLPFIYEEERTGLGATALAGLPAYLELALALGLPESIGKWITVKDGPQGWSDVQVVMALVMLNLAGGDCVEDIDHLEKDAGFCELVRQAENYGVPAPTAEHIRRRWRRERRRSVPSKSVIFRYLDAFHNEKQEALREKGKAFIPADNDYLSALRRVSEDLMTAIYRCNPTDVATLDMDATLIQTAKKAALRCYKGFLGWQPHNVFFEEQGCILYSEFRDGNVPAGYQQLCILEEALKRLPEGVKRVRLRSDTAGYQIDLLRYCAKGQNERFGVIEFAIGCDVTPEFKAAVARVPESDWRPLVRVVGKEEFGTVQEWAEVPFVSSDYAATKNAPQLRYLAVREALSQQPLPGLGAQLTLPFQTIEIEHRRSSVVYKLHGVVSNSTEVGGQIIWWYRGRCGKSEEAHSVMKEDLAGGQMPSFRFGANAAWWGIMLLAFNLEIAMKRAVLEKIEPGKWRERRMKAIRFEVISTPGRLVNHARQPRLRMAQGHPAMRLLIQMRERIAQLWHELQVMAGQTRTGCEAERKGAGCSMQPVRYG